MAEAGNKNVLVYKRGTKLYDPAFKNYPVMLLEQYTGGKAIIDGGRIEYKPFLKKVYDHYRNGALIIDDAAHFERNDPSPELNSILIDVRHLGIDCFLVFHGLRNTPIRLFEYVNVLILGYSSGNIEKKLNELPEPDDIKNAAYHVKRQVEQCGCDSQQPCRCGKRYTYVGIKL